MVSRLRAYWERVRTGYPGAAESSRTQSPATPPSTSTTFRPNPYETWHFAGQEIHYNGRPIDLVFHPQSPDVPLWTALVQGLVAYRDYVTARRTLRWRRIVARTEQWHDQVSRALHQHYDARMCGLALQSDGDDLKLNNVNLSQLLACYQTRPTARARQFLQGIQQKLCLLLARPRDTGFSAQLGDRVRRLYHDIAASLTRETIDTLCLPLPRRSVGRG